MILHRSVLLSEAVSLLDVHSNEDYIDCTLGGGGHTSSMLVKNAPRGRVLALDLDDETIRKTGASLKRFGKRLTIVRGNFHDVSRITRDAGFESVSGVLYDLGLSTDLIKERGRGFSFMTDEPLDMRFDASKPFRAEDIVNSWTEKEIADCIFSCGEERYSRRIAKQIVTARRKERIRTTGQLVAIIERSVPPPYRHGRIHCATRTFQALRIAVNDEIDGLVRSLQQSFELVRSGGRIVVITFHSLEDRVVKNYFRNLSKAKQALLLTKKPLTPAEDEIRENPASRSAKLRGIQKL